MRAFRYVLADVFTDVPLAGNQLGVFTDARDLDGPTMQALALELGFSETVFVLPPREGGHARIRIFTPSHELPFAGHPTLGTAFVLGGPLQLGVIELECDGGLVPVVLERDGSGRIVFGRMTQPVPTFAPFERAEELCAALGVSGSTLAGRGSTTTAIGHVYVGLESEAEVAALRPDWRALGSDELIRRSRRRQRVRRLGRAAGSCGCSRRATAWTRTPRPDRRPARSPVTSARHGLIGWGEQIEISQGSEIGRPSTLYAVAAGSGDEIEAVEVGGSAVIVARGEFRLP